MREATPEELDRMTAIFRECMAAGAFGLGSSTFDNHYGWNGVPVPSRLASDDDQHVSRLATQLPLFIF